MLYGRNKIRLKIEALSEVNNAFIHIIKNVFSDRDINVSRPFEAKGDELESCYLLIDAADVIRRGKDREIV